MGYRGRLIWPFLAELAQLDTAATKVDPDGAGPLTSGFDDDFREPVIVPVVGEQTGTEHRVEKDPILLPCQIEVARFEQLRMLATGQSPDELLRLVFHFADLELFGLVDADNGEATIRVNDRLNAIKRIETEELVQEFRIPLFATSVMPRSFGLDGLERNLLVVSFEERELSVRA